MIHLIVPGKVSYHRPTNLGVLAVDIQGLGKLSLQCFLLDVRLCPEGGSLSLVRPEGKVI